MKSFFIAIFIILSIVAYGQQSHIIDSTYLMVTENFKISVPGDTLYFTSGGISLINSEQLEVMLEIIEFVNDEALSQAIGLSITENEKKIEECKTLYENLLQNSKKSHEITTQSLQSTQKLLQEITQSLEETKKALVLANENVAASGDLIKKYKSAKLWQNILIGLAGVGVGVLITQ